MPLHPQAPHAYPVPPSNPGPQSSSFPQFRLVTPTRQFCPALPTFSGPSALQRPVFPPYHFFPSPKCTVTPPFTNPRPSGIPGPQELPAFTGPVKLKKLRQQRTAYTPEQKCKLEDLFARTKNPTLEQMEELEKKLKVSKKTLKVWFKNRRAKSRREQLGRQQQSGAQGPQEQPAPGQASDSGPSSSSGQGQHPALVQAPTDATPVLPVSATFQVPAPGPSSAFLAEEPTFSTFCDYNQALGQPRNHRQQGTQDAATPAPAPANPQDPDELQDPTISELLLESVLRPNTLPFLQSSDSPKDLEELENFFQNLANKEPGASK
ncbi:cone-rod homeobox protein-like [Octodon degus]|uniref:Cone-rod homeobox protein-like n=1 Tax=Octodon degus TaxID=10160 RepID=A0A6P3V900_OCTDE|nr:cone-rod homeobox protein-like [Octodon degus]